MSIFREIEIFPLLCLFSIKILRATTVYGISPLWRDIWAPSVTCLNLIFKIFISETFKINSLKPAFFIPVNVAARYKPKSVIQKEKSLLLRWTSAHSSKLCCIAELVRASQAGCTDSLCNNRCTARGYQWGTCDCLCWTRCTASDGRPPGDVRPPGGGGGRPPGPVHPEVKPDFPVHQEVIRIPIFD